MKSALKRLEGVHDADVSLKHQNASIVLSSEEILNLGILREAVEKADFSPRKISIKATGEIVLNKVEELGQITDLVLKVPGTGQSFLLVPLTKGTVKENEQVEKADLLPKLRAAFKAGKKKFTISGDVHEHKGFALGLSVEEFEPADQNR